MDGEQDSRKRAEAVGIAREGEEQNTARPQEENVVVRE